MLFKDKFVIGGIRFPKMIGTFDNFNQANVHLGTKSQYSIFGTIMLLLIFPSSKRGGGNEKDQYKRWQIVIKPTD